MFEISERAHAGLELMAALALVYQKDERLRLNSVGGKTGVSLPYLEEIAASLRKAGLIEGRQGPGGGYRLTREPSKISLEHIAIALEGHVELVDCQKTSIQCPHEQTCRTKFVWHRLQHTIQAELRSITLADIT